jgi:hypothetical protein
MSVNKKHAVKLSILQYFKYNHRKTQVGKKMAPAEKII